MMCRALAEYFMSALAETILIVSLKNKTTIYVVVSPHVTPIVPFIIRSIHSRAANPAISTSSTNRSYKYFVHRFVFILDNLDVLILLIVCEYTLVPPPAAHPYKPWVHLIHVHPPFVTLLLTSRVHAIFAALRIKRRVWGLLCPRQQSSFRCGPILQSCAWEVETTVLLINLTLSQVIFIFYFFIPAFIYRHQTIHTLSTAAPLP